LAASGNPLRKRQQDQTASVLALAHRAGSPRFKDINDLAKSGKPKLSMAFRELL
jgi:hypothetical protein